MTRVQLPWPPRGLSRIEAARYIGVCPTTFDGLVRDGRMPRPVKIGARRIFDRNELDRAFDALESGADDGANDWD